MIDNIIIRVVQAVHHGLDNAEVIAAIPDEHMSETRDGYWERVFIVVWRRPIPEGMSRLGTDGYSYATHRVHVNSDGDSACFMGHYDQKRDDALADMLERARVKAPADEPVKDPSLPDSYRADNLIGNVIGVIADRTGEEIKHITDRIASEWGDGDFDTAEQVLWDGHFGPVCDYVMDGAGIEWPTDG